MSTSRTPDGELRHVDKPRLLDLFCKAGGCSMGYHRAGFEVVGVDIAPQKNYPFEFVQADALTLDPEWLASFDAIHASPPCQHYSAFASMHPDKTYPDLIDPVRELLARSGRPWVMENVETSPLVRGSDIFGSHGVMLCGSSFGLGARGLQLRRHRVFEANFPVDGPPCRHQGNSIGVYGHGGHTKKHRMAYAAEAREALGIDWMNRDEMSEAIPPAYTEYIGRQLLAHVDKQVAA